MTTAVAQLDEKTVKLLLLALDPARLFLARSITPQLPSYAVCVAGTQTGLPFSPNLETSQYRPAPT